MGAFVLNTLMKIPPKSGALEYDQMLLSQVFTAGAFSHINSHIHSSTGSHSFPGHNTASAMFDTWCGMLRIMNFSFPSPFFSLSISLVHVTLGFTSPENLIPEHGSLFQMFSGKVWSGLCVLDLVVNHLYLHSWSISWLWWGQWLWHWPSQEWFLLDYMFLLHWHNSVIIHFSFLWSSRLLLSLSVLFNHESTNCCTDHITEFFSIE